MQHYLSKRGYISLYVILFICIAIGISFIAGLLSAVGIALPNKALIAIKAVVLFSIPIVCAYRFLRIENRPPTFGEGYFISLFSFLPVFILMLLKTGMIMGGAAQSNAGNMESFAAQTMLNFVILSGISIVMLLLSYGIIAKFWSRTRAFA